MWTIKKGELRVNTKEGGVIIGKLEGEVPEIKLPGAKTMSFKKWRDASEFPTIRHVPKRA